MTAALEATGLGKRFGRVWALSGCDLSLPAGRVVGLVGPNGAGKTTFLHLAVGLLAPTTGAIEVLGATPARGPAELAQVGFVAQDSPTYAGLSVADHLRLGRWLNPAWDAQLAERRVRRLGLERRRKAGQLSGGQRAQLALTLAIAKRPRLLLLDEPVASLDPLARREFLQQLMESVAEHEMTVVLSSHLVADLERVCDHLVVLIDSRVELAGDIDELLAQHHRLVGPRRHGARLPVRSGGHRGQPHRPAEHLARAQPLADLRPELGRRRGRPRGPGARLHGQGRRPRALSACRARGAVVIRFAWRQFRLQVLIVFAALAAVAVLAVVTRPGLTHLYDLHDTDALLNRYGSYENIARLVLVVPALVGVFWGAPLLARELETGTFRLVWTQSVTRRRWLAVKLGLVGGASVAVAGLLGWVVTWWSVPVDRVNLDRFSSPLIFSERGLVPLGYAAFAFALGVVLGLLLRRTVPAMAATLAVFVGVRLAVTQWARPHLMAPVDRLVPLTAAGLRSLMFTTGPNGPATAYLNSDKRGDWVLSSGGHVVDASGKVAYGLGKTLGTESPPALRATLARLGLRVQVLYQPASRYWTFQIAETAMFVALAVLLVAFCFWWVPRRLA